LGFVLIVSLFHLGIRFFLLLLSGLPCRILLDAGTYFSRSLNTCFVLCFLQSPRFLFPSRLYGESPCSCPHHLGTSARRCGRYRRAVLLFFLSSALSALFFGLQPRVNTDRYPTSIISRAFFRLLLTRPLSFNLATVLSLFLHPGGDLTDGLSSLAGFCSFVSSPWVTLPGYPCNRYPPLCSRLQGVFSFFPLLVCSL